MGQRELGQPERGASSPHDDEATPTPYKQPILHYNRVREGRKEGRKGSRQRNFVFDGDVNAILDALPARQRTAWVEEAIRVKAGLRSPKARLQARLDALAVQEEQVRREKELLQVELDGTSDVESEDLRRKVRQYLRSRPGEAKQRVRAEDLGLTWEQWCRIREEVQPPARASW